MREPDPRCDGGEFELAVFDVAAVAVLVCDRDLAPRQSEELGVGRGWLGLTIHR